MTSAPLTEAEIREFVTTWYHYLDVHVPLEEMLTMVTEDVMCKFPEVTTYSKQDFADWYKRVTGLFFDEVHTTEKLEITTDGNEGKVEITTHWQASTWTPPEAKSKRIDFRAGQTWKVVRSPETGKVAVAQYIVNTFDPVGESVLPT